MADRLATLLLINVLLMGGPAAAAESPPAEDVSCAARKLLPEHVRPQSCALIDGAVAGLERSTTFRSLVARIATLDGIVYVMPTPIHRTKTHRVLDGGLVHGVRWIGSRRVLTVTVGLQTGDESLETMAHEFQHAIEVLSSSASNEKEIDALFARIGIPIAEGVTETNAATKVERMVRRELAANRK